MQLPFEIDYVFPGVNDTDKVGRNNFKQFCAKKGALGRVNQLENERFRDGGLLKFLLRSIAINMPGLRKLHLLVSNKEQVPQGVNQTGVHVVLHEHFIPHRFLPCFNSTAIEMFLPNIPDLAEHFIYGNDDMFAMNPMEPSDFFTIEGKPKIAMRHLDAQTIKDNQFRIVCSNQWGKMMSKLHIRTDHHYFMRPIHSMSPMVKSKCNDAITTLGRDYVESTVSNFRNNQNLNQYIFTNYCFLTEYFEQCALVFEYAGAEKPKHLVDCFASTKAHILCANDCTTSMSTLQLTQLQILCAAVLEHRFPNKSKYEN